MPQFQPLARCPGLWSEDMSSQILPPGAGQNRAKLRKDIEEYHLVYSINFDETDIDTFMISRRPDGLAFDKKKSYVCF